MTRPREFDLMDDEHRGWKEPEAETDGWREFIPTGWIEWLHVAALIAVFATGIAWKAGSQPDRDEQITMEMMP